MRSQLLWMVSGVAVMTNKTKKRLCNFSCNRRSQHQARRMLAWLFFMYVRRLGLYLWSALVCVLLTRRLNSLKKYALQEGNPSYNLNTLCFDGRRASIYTSTHITKKIFKYIETSHIARFEYTECSSKLLDNLLWLNKRCEIGTILCKVWNSHTPKPWLS